MSRRKDRDRFLNKKAFNPDYRGFRGYSRDATTSNTDTLQPVTCSVCGRKRNVDSEIAREQGQGYVCLSCQDEEGAETQQGTAGESSPADST